MATAFTPNARKDGVPGTWEKRGKQCSSILERTSQYIKAGYNCTTAVKWKFNAMLDYLGQYLQLIQNLCTSPKIITTVQTQ